ncbi:alpha-amylase family glycosyl hydrolase [Luteimonas pelagia]
MSARGLKPGVVALSVALALAGCATAPESPYSDRTWRGTDEPFAANAVYFVVTDRFVNGDPSNDQRDQGGELKTFDRPLAPCDGVAGNIGYLGGDFRGIVDNLDYIRSMGFGALWITPVVDNPDEAFTGGTEPGCGTILSDRGKTGYHGYWGVNFFELDEHLPSDGLDFRDLADAVHARDMKLVLDIVGNHGSPAWTMTHDQPLFGELYGRDGTLLADHQNLPPTELDPDGNPLHAFFNDTGPIEWGTGSIYDGNLAQLGDFDAANPAVLDYLSAAYLHWIDQGADAFRIDTIAWMPTSFWQAFTERVRAKHPGFYMFGEAFDYEAANIAKHTLPGQGEVSVLDFPMKQAMDEVFGRKDAGFERLAPTLQLVDGPYANPYDLATFYDNHDMPRMDASDEGFIDAHHWLFTARGIPVVYYGSETGFMRGRAEHAGNRSYFGQDRVDAAAANPIQQALKRIGNVRRATPALQRGVQLNLELHGDRAAFYRVLQDGDVRQLALVLLNKGDAPAAFEVSELLEAGTWRDAVGGGTTTIVTGGTLASTVPAHGAQVWILDGPVTRPDLAAALDAATGTAPSP